MILVLILLLPLIFLLSVTSSYLLKPRKLNKSKGRVGVVGGGIAGCGAAWSLSRAGYEVEIFEAKDDIGGNAKTHLWDMGNGEKLRTGVSVLAWPHQLFHNYTKLVSEFNVKTEPVELPFIVVDENHNVLFNHGRKDGLRTTLSKDFDRFNRMLAFVSFVNSFFQPRGKHVQISLYHFSLLNPMNYVPVYLMSKFFFVSEDFWNLVFVPLYASGFLTIHQKFVPCSVIPVSHAILPIDAVPILTTWSENSSLVLSQLVKGVKVHINSPVSKVQLATNSNPTVRITANSQTTSFDRVVFACDATTALTALVDAPLIHKILLSRVTYIDGHDKAFLRGYIHREKNAVTGGSPFTNEVMSRNCNYMRVIRNPRDQSLHYENTFLLSSWLPSVRRLGKKAIEPLLISYNMVKPPAEHFGCVENIHNHPDLSANNQLIMALLRLVQGKGGVYFAGSYTVPANGHDLSLLSGFVVAAAIGAPHPFAKDAKCRTDFELVAWLMGLTSATKN